MTKTWGGKIHGLTESRWRVLRATVDYWEAHEFSPCMRDIAGTLGVDVKTVRRALKAMARDELLSVRPGINRSIVILDAGRRALREYETGRVAVNGEAGRSE